MSYDTRTMLHYFRLMPNRQFLFGLRGGTSGSKADFEHSKKIARADFKRMFPAWKNVETPWFWSGMLCLSRRLVPYTGPLSGMQNAWAGLAYHGNGVAMGSYSGKILAGMVLGDHKLPKAPTIMTQSLERFELPRIRRHFLKPLYYLVHLKDSF